MNLSRSEFPPNGWVFFQPQTGWSAPTPASSTFDQTVVLIIKHRLANPAIVTKHGLPTDVVTVGNELESFTKKRLNIPDPPKAPPPLLQRFGALAAGAKSMEEWWSAGGDAVPQVEAERRAAICVRGNNGERCPQNDQGDWMATFTVSAQEKIKLMFDARNKRKLSTRLDSKLQLCNACLCPLALKVHMPPEHIHTTEAAKKLMPHFCWLPK